MPILDELFATPTPLMDKVGEFHGITLYTSDRLKEKFINSYENSSYKDYNPEKFKKLVNSNLLTPVFSSRSMIRFFIIRPFQSKDLVTLGFFSPIYKRIFILIDSTADIFGRTMDDIIAENSIHEIIHYLSDKNPKLFLSLFIKELTSYYKYTYTRIFSTFGLTNKETRLLVIKLYNKFETGGEMRSREFKNLLEKYLKPKSELKSEEFDETLNNYIKAVTLFYKGDTKCFYIPYGYIHYNHVQAYKDAFSYNPAPHICYQESIVPSEVICKISSLNFIKPKIIRVLESL